MGIIIDLHTLGNGGEQAPPSSPQRFSDFNWMSIAWQGALKHMNATLLSQYEDSQVLAGAANLVQVVGSSTETYNVTGNASLITGAGITPNDPNAPTYFTIAQLIQAQGYYAGEGSNNGNSQASVVQSLIGQAQSQLSNRVQIGQQYVTQETNLATNIDSTGAQAGAKELEAINNFVNQSAQLAGALS